jgi:hypothetical protein
MFRTYDNNFQIAPLVSETLCLKPHLTLNEILSETIAAVLVGPPF